MAKWKGVSAQGAAIFQIPAGSELEAVRKGKELLEGDNDYDALLKLWKDNRYKVMEDKDDSQKERVQENTLGQDK